MTRAKSKDPVVAFLYLLMRDRLTPGAVESIMEQVEPAKGQRYRFTNGYLARYSKNIRNRLRNTP